MASSHGIDRDIAPVSVATAARTATDPLPSFRDVLDAFNPLQYLPVVGTIYRIVTGDEGSPGVRTAVSMVTGMLMGGPFGLLTSMAADLIERMVHPEAALHAALVGPSTKPVVVAAEPASPPAPALLSQAMVAYSQTQRMTGIGR